MPNTEVNTGLDDAIKNILPNFGSVLNAPTATTERNYDMEDAVIMDGNDTVNDD
jgi:hypothetical protein